MRILITGGSGFLGLALSEALLDRGAEVHTLSDVAAPGWALAALPPGATHHLGDVTDAAALAGLLARLGVAAIVHAAAATPDAAAERAGPAAAVFALNVGATAGMIEAAAAAGVGRVMAISSVAVYGRTRAETDRLDEETTVCAPQSIYGVSKLAAEMAALRLGRVRGIDVIAPRLGPLWGPWERRTALRATPSPAFQIVEAARRGAPAAISGAAPLVWAPDAADALARLLDAPGAAGRPVNVGAAATLDLAAFAAQAATTWPSRPGAAPEPVEQLAPDRPPMRLDLLEALIGPMRQTPPEVGLRAYRAWLDALPDPAAPFAC